MNRIDNVEIFAAGTWNGDKYNVEDLDKMVAAFEETKALFKPYLKLGHDDDQVLLQRDGLPAAGWVDRVYRIGEKLFADFVDIPQKIYDLIKNRAYRKVSSEIYWNIEVSDKKYPYLLGAVALLGADTPAVTSLNDIMAFYRIKNHELKDQNVVVKFYSYDAKLNYKKETRMSKTEAEIKLEIELADLRNQNADAADEIKQYTQDLEAIKAERDALRAEKETAEAAALAAAKEVAKANLEKFVTELVSEKLVTPAMKPFVIELLGEEKKEYTIADKKLSKQDLIKQILKLHTASDVNLEEGSEDGQETKHKFTQDDLLKKVQEYQDEHKCSYKLAYKAIVQEFGVIPAVAINKMADAAE